jgi:acetoin utilization deacetylase AcuC-like enzyme
MLTVYSDAHRLHRARHELIDGRLAPAWEVPERAEAVLARVREVGLGDVIAPDPEPDDGLAAIARVHDGRFLDFLAGAWEAWEREGRDWEALPLAWPTRHLRQIEPDTIDGKLSYFSLDAGTPITSGTWAAATASAQVALTGQRRVAAGDRAVFALCRPPGHHAAADVYGGYCFLNNAAIATQAFIDGGADRVAVLDIDYHHGNGTQAIFYDRADVLFCSIHGDPRQEFPYFLGYQDETGVGAGQGFTVNHPLPWGTGFDRWGEALDAACERVVGHRPDAIVVSLGVDTFERDPISQFRLRSEDYLDVGRRIAAIGRPVLFVLEGGYALDEIGTNVVNVLTGFGDA